ncbi:MAG: type IV pilus assembly protein PilM [Candidatus Aureabacteria bacterium]|nr:type IV pilus assembly protein PilM [Candidatus Auribacterota bacterium]
MFFGRKKKIKDRMLIVDVGTQYVKVLDLTVKKDQATLHNYRILNLIQSGRRFVIKEIGKIIKKSLLDMGIAEKYSLTSVAGKSVVVRFMDLPNMTIKELKSSLKYQADLHIPFDMNDAMYDCQILPDSTLPQGRMRVVVAAALKKEAIKVLEVIRSATLIPKKVDVDAMALANAFVWGMSKEDEDQSLALVNIGASRTNITILKKGIPSLCRELNFGGISLTESIASGLNISFDEAEAKKIEGDSSISRYIEESIKPLCNGLAQSFDFFEGSVGTHVSHVYISGGGAQIRGMMDYLKNSLNRNVRIWNSLRSINIDSLPEREKELLQSNSPLLTVALGIGLGEGEKKGES